MVGDRASRGGGAARVGIATLILHNVPNYTWPGLDVILPLAFRAKVRKGGAAGASGVEPVSRRATRERRHPRARVVDDLKIDLDNTEQPSEHQ